MSLFKIIDEYTLLERFLKNKSLINGETHNILKVYTKYLHSNRKSKDDIRNELDSAMEKHYIGYVRADWNKTLDSMVSRFTKKDGCEFKKVNEVTITDNELEFIRNIDNLEIEKVMFIMLVVSKAYGDNGMVYTDMREIFKYAKYKYERRTVERDIQRSNIINDLYKRKVVGINERNCVGTGVKLNYILDGNTIYNIIVNEKNEGGLIYYYLNWRGGFKIKECESCKCLFEIKSKTKENIFCIKCLEKRVKSSKLKYYHEKIH